MNEFTMAFGRRPRSAWTAPGRVNLIGEHTDYNEGFVLPIALSRGITAWAAPTTDGMLRLASATYPGRVTEISLDDLEPGLVRGWPAYVAGTVWSLMLAGAAVTGCEVFVTGDLPVGAGLSSSAALECAVASALNDMFSSGLSLSQLIEVTRKAENSFVGVPTGGLDQSASLLCREGHALFLDTRTMANQHVPFDLDAAGLDLLVVNTRVSHRLADGQYALRRADCEAAARELGVSTLRDLDVVDLPSALPQLSSATLRQRVRHVVTENGRVLDTVNVLSRHDGRIEPESLGALLTASHRSLRDDYDVSCIAQDLAMNTALTNGAFGARMTGGGFGGSTIALARRKATPRVTRAVIEAFAAAGLRRPEIFSVVASAGARRSSGSPV